MNTRQAYLLSEAKHKLGEDLKWLKDGSSPNLKSDAISTCKQVLDAFIAGCLLVDHEPVFNRMKVKFKKISPSIYSVWLE